MKCSQLLWMGLLLVGTLQPATSTAQPWQYARRDAGPYFHVDLGGNIPEKGDFKGANGFAGAGKVSYDPGVSVALAGGYEFNPYIAAEVQTGWSMNAIDSIQGWFVDDAWFSTVPILANIRFQFPIPNTIVVPFIGGGVGGAATIFDTDFMSTGALDVVGSDSDFVFAWQGFAGLRFDINEQMSAGVVYKYFSTEDSTFSYPPAFYYGPDLNLDFEGIRLHEIMLMFMFRF